MTTTENAVTTDPRPLYRDALGWVAGLVARIRAEQLIRPTPCSEFDVRTLLGHVVATVDKIRVIGEEGSPFTMPHVAPLPADDDWSGALADAVERMWTVWSDVTRLDAELTVPWGTAPPQSRGAGRCGSRRSSSRGRVRARPNGWPTGPATPAEREEAPGRGPGASRRVVSAGAGSAS